LASSEVMPSPSSWTRISWTPPGSASAILATTLVGASSGCLWVAQDATAVFIYGCWFESYPRSLDPDLLIMARERVCARCAQEAHPLGTFRCPRPMRLAADDDLLRMATLNNQALLHSGAGDVVTAVRLIEEAIEIAVRTGNRHREAVRDRLLDR